MRIGSLCLGVLILSNAVCAPVWAQTALERVLAMVEANPNLGGMNTFLNIASHVPMGDSAPDVVDSSVNFVQLPSEHPEEPQEDLLLNVDTTALGANNTGRIRYQSTHTGPEEAVPLTLIAVNAANTQAPILAPVNVVSTAPLDPNSQLSTKAVGAMNTGAVQIVIQEGTSN